VGVLPLPFRRRQRTKFERAADGSMTLMEHLRELRDRLFKACLGILLGMVAGWFLATPVQELLVSPYCAAMLDAATADNGGVAPANWSCDGLLLQLQATSGLLVKLKIAMWLGLILGAPMWLFQLWAFIAPGLHRHERRWAYAFAAAAAPLFALGGVLAYFVVATGLEFLLSFQPDEVATQLEISGYIDFITGLMLLFGVAFEFPLAILLLNVAGVVTGRQMLRWWRVTVFLFFVFAAVATPTADPFGMTFLALALSGLYFGAVGLAFLNDRRRRRRDREDFADLPDDQVSPLEYDGGAAGEIDPVSASGPVTASEAITASGPVAAPQALDRRYDDVT
jgi:sec-independent protein translocase protein TatC